jgi:class 3 adenylate cyclase/YHS domain-containing protein
MSSGPSVDELATAMAEPVDRVREWLALGLLGVAGADDRLPADAPVRARLVRLCLDHGLAVDAIVGWVRAGEMDRHVPLLAPAGAHPTCDLGTAADRLGMDVASLERLCRALGLVPGAFDEDDLAGVALFKRALDAGFPEDALMQLVRVLKDAMDRVAFAEAHLFHFYVPRALQARGLAGEALRAAVWAVGEATAGLDAPALQYFHRSALRRALEQTAVLEVAEHHLAPSVDQPPGHMEVTVVFVDLSGFTALTEAMGDVKTAEVLDRFSALVRESVTASGGQVVKQIGDAFLLVFHEPRAAVACALDIEARATAAPAFPAVRAGIHHGPVLYREGDYVGATVNLAARVVAEADRHQVLVTEAVHAAVRGGMSVELGRLPKRTVKGVRDAVVLYEVRPVTPGARAQRVTDPVCAMELGPGEDAARLVLEGREYRFCSDACLRRFVAASEHYVGAADAGTRRAPTA